MKITFIILVLFLQGCATTKIEMFNKKVKAGKCEEAAELMPENVGLRVIKEVKNVSNTSASLILTGAAYTSEFVLIMTGSFVVGVIICSPVILAEGSLKGNGHASTECIKAVAEGVANGRHDYKWGEKVFKKTKNMRCPNITPMAKRIIKVSQCFEKRDNQKSIKQAQKHLFSIYNVYDLFNCVEEKEREELKNVLYRVRGKIASFGGNIKRSSQERKEIEERIEKENKDIETNANLVQIREKEKREAQKKKKDIIAAVKNGKNSKIHKLVVNHIDANLKDEKGRSLLMIAAFKGYYSTTELLLGKLADIKVKDSNGKSALDYAKMSGNKRVIALLEYEAELERKARSAK